MSRWLFACLAVIVTLAAGAAGYYLQATAPGGAGSSGAPPAADDPDHTSVLGTKRPAFTLPGPDGDRHAISKWDGDVLAINFWATWCKPCKEEIPEFVELQEKYRDRNVTFIGVAIDRGQPVTEFIRRYDVNYPVLIGEQAAMAAAKAYGNRLGALPYTAFVDRSGRIAHVHRGRLPKHKADAILSDLTSPAG